MLVDRAVRGRACPACAIVVRDRAARWCGRCGARLAAPDGQARRPRHPLPSGTGLVALTIAVVVGAAGGALLADRPATRLPDGAVVLDGGGDTTGDRESGAARRHAAGRVVATDGGHTLLARSGGRGTGDAAATTGQFVLLDADGREVWRAAGTARGTCVRHATFTPTSVEVTLCHGGAVAFHRTEGFVLARG